MSFMNTPFNIKKILWAFLTNGCITLCIYLVYIRFETTIIHLVLLLIVNIGIDIDHLLYFNGITIYEELNKLGKYLFDHPARYLHLPIYTLSIIIKLIFPENTYITAIYIGISTHIMLDLLYGKIIEKYTGILIG